MILLQVSGKGFRDWEIDKNGKMIDGKMIKEKDQVDEIFG